MPDWLSDILKFGSGVATGWLANVWRIGAERAGRRRTFCGFLRIHVQRFDAVDWKQFAGGELFQMHQDSVAAIADECAKIWADVPPKRRLRFDAARSAYCSLKRQDVEPYDLSDYPNNAQAILFPRYERGRKRVTDLLREMMEYAK